MIKFYVMDSEELSNLLHFDRARERLFDTLTPGFGHRFYTASRHNGQSGFVYVPTACGPLFRTKGSASEFS
jgi:hypothetical protein